MSESRRGAGLTVFAALFALLAIEDIVKPFSAPQADAPGVKLKIGIVFFGARLSAAAAEIIGPALGIFLLAYAAGIWRMRRYALYAGYGYAIYVALNLFLFFARNPPPATRGDVVFNVVYVLVALGLSWTAAILIGRRRAALI